MTKLCKKCGREFISNDSRKIYCTRDCYRTDWVSQRDFDYKRNYGISTEVYNQMFEKQNGCCKICGRHQSEFKKRLHVDHNHETGKVRSLLCHNCNLALGRLQENPKTIAAMLEYLQW